MRRPKTAIASVAYMVVTAFALVGISGALAVLVKGSLSQPESEKTAIETQIASAREIRESLARPIPLPEPLPPISSKVRAAELKVAETNVAEAKPEATNRRHRVRVARQWFQARQAFASFEPYRQQQPFFMSFGGRHYAGY